MFKLAFCAGHYLHTPGKRIPKQLDPKETREWMLNDRIADHLQKAAAERGMETLRTDDPTGEAFVDIPERTAAANAWGADLYVDIHHNGALGIFDGSGVEIFSYPGSAQGRKYRDAIYEAVVAAGGLKGNRANPLQEVRFASLSMTKMPAVLVEYGYMDSIADVPVILTDDYARKVAYATVDAIAQVAGLAPAYPQAEFIRDVQRACGAKVDGIAGPETLSKTVTISEQKNRTHPVVAAVQKYLHSRGYTQVGKADGIAGVKFTAAVIAYQEDHRCWVDGEITAGHKTWKTLLGLL
ncbi:MAG: N-acetylmuramoyl-L-alanine amidase [Oscillospiraceae bacterium]|nr:N-acetylmuramoyl-L-alanine amidase [Oscillospiraceae bacterium]